MSDLLQTSSFKTSPELVRKLYENSIVKNYEAGKIILNENAPISSIPIVTRGVLKVIRTDDEGREILLYYIRAGESCIMSFLGGIHNERSIVRAEVEEDSEILFLPINKVMLFIKEYPEWLDYIFRMYHKRFEELLDIVNAIAFTKVDDRLLELLRVKAEISGSKTLNITHEQLANDLGTARVVVSRLLKRLEEMGVVELGRNRIRLLKG